jgi:hypothetical protein
MPFQVLELRIIDLSVDWIAFNAADGKHRML